MNLNRDLACYDLLRQTRDMRRLQHRSRIRYSSRMGGRPGMMAVDELRSGVLMVVKV